MQFRKNKYGSRFKNPIFPESSLIISLDWEKIIIPCELLILNRLLTLNEQNKRNTSVIAAFTAPSVSLAIKIYKIFKNVSE